MLTRLPLGKMAATLAEDNFKCIFFNENDRIPIRFSLKFVPRSPIDNKPVLVQVIAWRLSVPTHYLNQCWPSSQTHICGTRWRWVNKYTKIIFKISWEVIKNSPCHLIYNLPAELERCSFPYFPCSPWQTPNPARSNHGRPLSVSPHLGTECFRVCQPFLCALLRIVTTVRRRFYPGVSLDVSQRHDFISAHCTTAGMARKSMGWLLLLCLPNCWMRYILGTGNR